MSCYLIFMISISSYFVLCYKGKIAVVHFSCSDFFYLFEHVSRIMFWGYFLRRCLALTRTHTHTLPAALPSRLVGAHSHYRRVYSSAWASRSKRSWWWRLSYCALASRSRRSSQPRYGSHADAAGDGRGWWGGVLNTLWLPGCDGVLNTLLWLVFILFCKSSKPHFTLSQLLHTNSLSETPVAVLFCEQSWPVQSASFRLSYRRSWKRRKTWCWI